MNGTGARSITARPVIAKTVPLRVAGIMSIVKLQSPRKGREKLNHEDTLIVEVGWGNVGKD